MISPFKPGTPELAESFMKSVQPIAPSIWGQIGNTAKQIKNALGSFASTIFGGVMAVPKGGLYALANATAVPSVILNKAASIIDKTQNSIHQLFAQN